MELTPSFVDLLQHFAPLFTAPTYQTFTWIVAGWLLSHRHRYVTEVSHSCYYQAMPEQSSLFRRLRSELPLFILYDGLLHQPAGPYDTGKLTAEELDEVLDSIAEDEAFGSRAALDRVMEDLQAELSFTASAWPGLKDRAAYMQMKYNFLNILVEQLSHLAHPAAETFATGLLGDVCPLGPPSFGTEASALSLVPANLVAEAARWLREIDPQAFSVQVLPFRGVTPYSALEAVW